MAQNLTSRQLSFPCGRHLTGFRPLLVLLASCSSFFSSWMIFTKNIHVKACITNTTNNYGTMHFLCLLFYRTKSVLREKKNLSIIFYREIESEISCGKPTHSTKPGWRIVLAYQMFHHSQFFSFKLKTKLKLKPNKHKDSSLLNNWKSHFSWRLSSPEFSTFLLRLVATSLSCVFLFFLDFTLLSSVDLASSLGLCTTSESFSFLVEIGKPSSSSLSRIGTPDSPLTTICLSELVLSFEPD